ncbi:MAG: DUF1624 domain-containing protein [Coriobacteriia bacterium]|nr:DUF1624 domain-containing protein [Coriobacteriia bacterium]
MDEAETIDAVGTADEAEAIDTVGTTEEAGAGESIIRTTEAHTPKIRNRVRIFDILRGLALLSMATWHCIFDLINLYGMKIPWFYEFPTQVLWGQITVYCFILVSGACLNLGRKTARRGLVVFGCALLISLVTYLAMPEMFINFGILHMFGCCMLLAALLKPLLKKIPWGVGLAVCLALYLLLYLVPHGSIGILNYPLVDLPRELYSTSFLFPIGLPGPSYHSGDYYPIIPWVFLFFAGYFVFRPLKRIKLFTATKPGKNPIEFLGRYSLIAYMAHQPLILLVLMLLSFAGVL